MVSLSNRRRDRIDRVIERVRLCFFDIAPLKTSLDKKQIIKKASKKASKRRQVCCWLLGAFSIFRARPAIFFLILPFTLQEKVWLMRASPGDDAGPKM